MNTDNAFMKSWELIVILANYLAARYRDAGIKVAANFGKAWNPQGFCAGLAEIFYLSCAVAFPLYLIFRGFGADKGFHSVGVILLIVLAIVTCIG